MSEKRDDGDSVEEDEGEGTSWLMSEDVKEGTGSKLRRSKKRACSPWFWICTSRKTLFRSAEESEDVEVRGLGEWALVRTERGLETCETPPPLAAGPSHLGELSYLEFVDLQQREHNQLRSQIYQ